VRFCAKSG